MAMESELVMIALNWLICFVGGCLCVVRIGAMQGGVVKRTIRVQYMLWFALMAASGWSFLYDQPPTLTQMMLSAGILAHLSIGFKVWRHGPPAYAIKPGFFWGQND